MNRPVSRRRWTTRFELIWTTANRTMEAFHNHQLGSLTVLFFILLMFSAVLYLINSVAPIAPFVYSLI